MPLLNYTTRISADRTVSEIMQILARAGATGVTVQYGTFGSPQGIIFGLLIQDREIAFKLPVNIQGILSILQEDKDVPKRLKSPTQAERVAWRIVKDWIKANFYSQTATTNLWGGAVITVHPWFYMRRREKKGGGFVNY